MADGHIQVPADSIGKKVDAEELIRPDAVVVERQRVVIGSDGDSLERIECLLQELNLRIEKLQFALLDALN